MTRVWYTHFVEVVALVSWPDSAPVCLMPLEMVKSPPYFAHPRWPSSKLGLISRNDGVVPPPGVGRGVGVSAGGVPVAVGVRVGVGVRELPGTGVSVGSAGVLVAVGVRVGVAV